MPSQQINRDLNALSPQSRAQITSIDVHPRLFVALCIAARAESPVAPHPSHIQGIKLNVNAQLKALYSFITNLHPQNPTKTDSYRPALVIIDDLISE